jgi:hypothetical protein
MSIAPKCQCGHSKSRHYDTSVTGVDMTSCLRCDCSTYVPKRPLSSVRKTTTKPRKSMPRCRHCAHTFRAHCVFPKTGTLSAGCFRCACCPGYAAARRGSRASRRAPIVALRKTCNDLWSRCVRARPGGCECPREEHVGVYQGAHGFGKKSYPAVRHDLRNGWKLASGCHRFYTDHPIEWDEVMRSTRTPEVYAELRAKALAQVKPDLAAVAVELRAELARLGER